MALDEIDLGQLLAAMLYRFSPNKPILITQQEIDSILGKAIASEGDWSGITLELVDNPINEQ